MRYLFIVALLFSFVGTVNADAVPTATDAQNAPTVWTMSVYNVSGDDIQSGQAVRWDIDASTNDYSMWVEEVDAVADNRTAGATIYGQNLINGTTGEIIVRGPAIMWKGTNTCTTASGTDGIVESDINGQPVDITAGSGVEEAYLGFCAKDDASALANTLIGSQYTIIFIDTTLTEGT